MNLNNSNTPEAEKDRAQTPPWFFDSLQKYLNLKLRLDVCAEKQTTKCEHYYSLADSFDGLSQSWDAENFCNPPYSNIHPWIEKAKKESESESVTAMLIPDKAEVGFTIHAREVSDTVIHMPFRLNFLRPDGSPFMDKSGKKSGPKFPVCVYIVTPWGLNMPIRDTYFDFRTLK